MANEIVKYHSELNTIPLRKFTPVEMNLFFSIVSRMREKGDKTVRFTFDQLKDLSNYKATANDGDLIHTDDEEKADEDGFSIIAMWNWERKNYFIKE